MNFKNLEAEVVGLYLIILLVGLVIGLFVGVNIETSQGEKTTIYYTELCKRLQGSPNQEQGYCEISGTKVLYPNLLKEMKDKVK